MWRIAVRCALGVGLLTAGITVIVFAVENRTRLQTLQPVPIYIQHETTVQKEIVVSGVPGGFEFSTQVAEYDDYVGKAWMKAIPAYPPCPEDYYEHNEQYMHSCSYYNVNEHGRINLLNWYVDWGADLQKGPDMVRRQDFQAYLDGTWSKYRLR